MSGQAVDDQDDWVSPTLHKVGEKNDEQYRIQHALIDFKPKAALGADRADGVHGLSLAGSLDDRSAALQSVTPPQGTVRADPGFVQEEDIRPALFGPLPKFRVHLFFPLDNLLFISLVRSAQRLLRSDIERGQQMS